MNAIKVLELNDGYISFYVKESGPHKYYAYSDVRDLISELRHPHAENYELRSLSLVDSDYNDELSQYTDNELNKFFNGIIYNSIPEEEQKEIFELFWRNSDEFWC